MNELINGLEGVGKICIGGVSFKALKGFRHFISAELLVVADRIVESGELYLLL